MSSRRFLMVNTSASRCGSMRHLASQESSTASSSVRGGGGGGGGGGWGGGRRGSAGSYMSQLSSPVACLTSPRVPPAVDAATAAMAAAAAVPGLRKAGSSKALLRTELYSMETLSPLELEARVHELAQLVQVTM